MIGPFSSFRVQELQFFRNASVAPFEFPVTAGIIRGSVDHLNVESSKESSCQWAKLSSIIQQHASTQTMSQKKLIHCLCNESVRFAGNRLAVQKSGQVIHHSQQIPFTVCVLDTEIVKIDCAVRPGCIRVMPDRDHGGSQSSSRF